MEPFTIVCISCQSSIRVKNPNMVGQVANCPKCNSLIRIDAPSSEPDDPKQVQVPGLNAGPGGYVDSMAMTKDGMAPDFQPGELAPPPADDEYRLAPIPQTSAAPDGYQPTGDYEGTPVTSGDEWQPAAEEPLVPSDEWQSESSNRTRQFLLVGFLGIGSIALAVTLFFVFVNWYSASNEGPEIASDGPSLTQPEDITSAAPEPEEVSNATETDSANANAEDAEAAGPADSSSDSVPATEVMPTDEGDSTEPIASIANLTPSALPDSLAADTDEASADTPLADDPAPTLEEQLAADDPFADIRKQLPNASFQEMAVGFLDYEMQFIPTHEDVLSGPPPVTAEDLGLSSGITRTAIPAIDLGERMSTQLNDMMFPESISLATMLNSWTQLSGIPTGIDLDALAAANIDTSKSPKILIQKGAVADAASQIGSAVGGRCVAIENRALQLTANPEALRNSIPETFDLEGVLEDSPENAAWLKSTLSRLTARPDESIWRLEGLSVGYDETKLSLLEWLQVVRLFETWRVQLGMEPALPGYSQARMVNQFVTPDLVQGLNQVLADAQYTLQAEPVGDVISRICAAQGISCFIDWPAVGQNGLGPSTTRVVLTHRRKLGFALADFADAYGLEFVVLSPTSLWVTTPQRYRSQPKYFVLPGNGQTAEQWEQSLRPLTPADENGIREIVVIETPDQKNILVRCCRPHIVFSNMGAN